MRRLNVALTAGFNRSPTVIALAELLTRQGHNVDTILVVTPFNLRRLRTLAKSRERGFVARARVARWASRRRPGQPRDGRVPGAPRHPCRPCVVGTTERHNRGFSA